jgi:hypothetical protein
MMASNTLFSDDFESYAVNIAPTAPWLNSSGAGATGFITFDNGSQTCKLTGATTAGMNACYGQPMTSASAYKLQARIKVQGGYANAGTARIKLYGASSSIAELGYGWTGSNLCVKYYTTSVGFVTDNAVILTPSIYYTFIMEVDRSIGSANFITGICT